MYSAMFFSFSTSLCCSYRDVHDLRAQFLSMFRVQTEPMIADGRKKRVELNQEPFDLRTVNIKTSLEALQLDKYETDPSFIQLSQNFTSDCLLI